MAYSIFKTFHDLSVLQQLSQFHHLNVIFTLLPSVQINRYLFKAHIQNGEILWLSKYWLITIFFHFGCPNVPKWHSSQPSLHANKQNNLPPESTVAECCLLNSWINMEVSPIYGFLQQNHLLWMIWVGCTPYWQFSHFPRLVFHL